MLVFSTSLPLKSEVKRENCIKVFKEWVESKKRYKTGSIPEGIYTDDEFTYSVKNSSIATRNYSSENLEVTVFRLEFHDGRGKWITDCVFVCENGKKNIVIQLDCNSEEYTKSLAYTQPGIVKAFAESELCELDAGIPVSYAPIDSDGEYYDKCVSIINGKSENFMPVVYVSSDYWGAQVLDSDELAKQLGGVAHVFVERKPETAERLRKDTDGKNVYNEWIGVYYPGASRPGKFKLNSEGNKERLLLDVVKSVTHTVLNKTDRSLYDWHRIGMLLSRQKYNEELNAYLKEFDGEIEKYKRILEHDAKEYEYEKDQLYSEIEGLEKKVEELTKSKNALQAQLDGVKMKNGTGECFFDAGDEEEYCLGEKKDLLISILKKAEDYYPENSRGRHLIASLLSANEPSGRNEEIVEGVKSILSSGEKLDAAARSALTDLGFVINDEGPHYKMTYHGDSRYQFPISKTPSDGRRGGKNLASDVCRIIKIVIA